MGNVSIEGLDNLEKRLNNLASKKNITKGLEKACMLVLRDAVKKAPKGRTGDLQRSIDYRVSGNEGVVYTNLEYAPYIEYGTGAFREENPTSGYWVYVLESNGSTPSSKSSKRYTLEEAKQIVAMMRADGIEAVYTEGREPQPFMRPALDENKKKIAEILGEAIKE